MKTSIVGSSFIHRYGEAGWLVTEPICMNELFHSFSLFEGHYCILALLDSHWYNTSKRDRVFECHKVEPVPKTHRPPAIYIMDAL